MTGAHAGHAQASDTTRDGPPNRWNVATGRAGSAHLELALLYDVSGFRQDTASVAQVGALATVGRVRTDRIAVDGTIGASHPWRYLVAANVRTSLSSSTAAINVSDLAVSIPLGAKAWLALGRQKESISEEMLASTRILPHVERSAAVLAFIPRRNDGMRLWGTLSTTSYGRGGWTIGVFNDFLFNRLPMPENGEQVSGRMFWALSPKNDTTRVVQVALNGRWTDDQDSTLRFKARPEVREAPNFLDTGPIVSSGAALGDAGVLVQQGAVSLTAEALPVRVTGVPASGTLFFNGSYVELAWRPRGEPRAYDAETGSLGRVQLGKHRSAIELGARFTHVNLTDGSVDGGVFDRTSLGITWYGPHDLRAQADYGYATLLKNGGVGRTQLFTMRVQWEAR